MNADRKTRGFTLIELLVVVSIIAMLMSILMPSLQKAKVKARLMTCMSNQRSIAVAMVTYSISNKGRLFLRYDKTDAAVLWKNAVPYSWPDKGLVEPMKPYLGIMDVAYCPLSKLRPYHVTSASNSHYGDWIVNLMWLPGLQESRGRFFEQKPSVASLNIGTSSGTKLLISDRNNYHIGESWGWSNHAGGQVIRPTLQGFVEELKGSNRIYADCHGEYAQPDQLGKDNGKPTELPGDARFSHLSGGSRPYYW